MSGARQRVIAVVGATATGKTALGEALADAVQGEIVCADSRQVFAELDIGTGKPSAAEAAARPHHLFDARRLGEATSAGWYAEACAEVRAGIHSRGRIPVLVGGSGLYIAAAQRGLAGTPPSDPAIRERLRHELAEHGASALHARLAERDPESAARLHPNDAQRVTRALEVLESSGKPLSAWHAETRATASDEVWTVIELDLEANTLNRRIRERAERMFAGGLLEETRTLLDSDRGDALRALQAIGYDEAIAHLGGEISLTKATKHCSLRTRQLAKRQRTWFRHQIDALRLDATMLDLDHQLALACDTFERGRGGAVAGGEAAGPRSD